MASVVAQFADTMIITSDNPRTENPRAIIDEILSGLPADRRESVTVEPDRRVAISMILSQPGPSDVVLIAGKGHENYQILGIERTHFDDCEEVRSLLQGS